MPRPGIRRGRRPQRFVAAVTVALGIAAAPSPTIAAAETTTVRGHLEVTHGVYDGGSAEGWTVLIAAKGTAAEANGEIQVLDRTGKRHFHGLVTGVALVADGTLWLHGVKRGAAEGRCGTDDEFAAGFATTVPRNRNDYFATLSGSVTLPPATVDGAGDDDTLADDALEGGLCCSESAGDLRGCPGADSLDGGPDNDTLLGEDSVYRQDSGCAYYVSAPLLVGRLDSRDFTVTGRPDADPAKRVCGKPLTELVPELLDDAQTLLFCRLLGTCKA